MRSKFSIRILLFVVVIAMSATMSQAVLTEKDVDFYAYTYGDGVPVHNSQCGCQVGPCPGTYELVGHYHIDCYGNRTEEWGYTSWNGECGAANHPVDKVVTIIGTCPQ